MLSWLVMSVTDMSASIPSSARHSGFRAHPVWCCDCGRIPTVPFWEKSLDISP